MNNEMNIGETLAVIQSDLKKLTKHFKLDRRRQNDERIENESTPEPDNIVLDSINKAIADLTEQKSFTEEQVNRIINDAGEYLHKKQDEHNTEQKHLLEAISTKLDERPAELQKTVIRREHNFTLDFKNSKAALTMTAMAVVIILSLGFNVHQATRNSDLHDSDIKYRYVKMQGGASAEQVYRLESIFEFDRNIDSVKTIRRQVERYEQLLKEYNETQYRKRQDEARSREIEHEAASVKKW